MATRSHKGLQGYDENLCTDQWKLQHFLMSHQTSLNQQCDSFEHKVAVDIIHHDTIDPSKVLTEQEKHKTAFQVARSLAQHYSSLGMREYEEGLQVLKEIKLKWDEGKNLTGIDIAMV